MEERHENMSQCTGSRYIATMSDLPHESEPHFERGPQNLKETFRRPLLHMYVERLKQTSCDCYTPPPPPPPSTKLKWGGYWFHLVRPPMCPSEDRIVFALYLHINTSYQATSEGLSRVKFISKCQNLEFWLIVWICNFDFVLFLLGIQYDSIIWVIIGRPCVCVCVCVGGGGGGGGGYPQNAGVLVVLVLPAGSSKQIYTPVTTADKRQDPPITLSAIGTKTLCVLSYTTYR